MKEINLNEILSRVERNKPFKWRNLILASMREACNQAIDACAENALLDNFNHPVSKNMIYTIDKQSILKVKDAIK